MPSKPKRPCRHVGCRELVDGGYCEQHKKQLQKQQDERRGSAHQRGYNNVWNKVRLIKLKMNPLCERCDSKGKITIAKLVHHIKSLRDGGSLTDMDNLMSLCVKCHDDIHCEQGDKW